MAKQVKAEDRKTAPVIAMLPMKVRLAVESLAEREKVSLSEIARRAVTQYVEARNA
jgi:molybdopterin-guanine dinucleotide biosynthesis protein A